MSQAEIPKMSQTISNDGPRFDKARPANYKKRHRWPKAWAVWCAFTEWVFDVWPRNS